jgi:cation transport ATPase
MISFKVGLHLLLCLVLLATVLARMVRMDGDTREAISVSFWLLAVAAGLGLIAPFAHQLWPEFGRFRIHWTTLAIEAAFVAVQLSTARHWRVAVPSQFQREPTP